MAPSPLDGPGRPNRYGPRRVSSREKPCRHRYGVVWEKSHLARQVSLRHQVGPGTRIGAQCQSAKRSTVGVRACQVQK